jgi:multiple sugar transport system permease protein
MLALMVTNFVARWNDYAFVQINLPNYPNLAYGMFTIEENKNLIPNSMPIFFTATVVSSLPIIILYACTQKLILTNMTAGGLKG